MMRQLLIAVAACAVAGCGSSGTDGNNASNTAASSRTPKPKRPAYCFFKSDETKAWNASRDAQGNVTVQGKAHMKDARYRPELGKAQIADASATIAPTISQNSGYASPDNWWDVKATIPDSAAVTSLKVECGAKTLAELTIERGR